MLHQRICSVAVQLGASFYASALLLTLCQHYRWHVNQILYWLKTQSHANAGVDAYDTLRHGRIKGATMAKSECIHFPLTLRRTHKRSPSLKDTDFNTLPPHVQLHKLKCCAWRAFVGVEFCSQQPISGLFTGGMWWCEYYYCCTPVSLIPGCSVPSKVSRTI